jgi:uncharacterized protein
LRLRKRGALGLAAACALATAVAAVEVAPSFPTRHFDDRAGVVSPAVATRLDDRLRAFETRTGHAVYVSIFPKLPSASLEDFTIRTATAWRVGRKGLDDGVILFVFVADRKLRLEVGYGLEAVIPDAIAHRILQEYVTPGLKAGRTDTAFEAGVAAILAAAEGRPLPTASAEPDQADVPLPAPPAPAAGPGPESLEPVTLDIVIAAVKEIAFFQVLGLPVGFAFLVMAVPLATSPILRFLPIRRRVKRGESLPRAWIIESLILLWLVASNIGSSSSGGSTTSSGGSSSGGGGGRFGGGGASGSW